MTLRYDLTDEDALRFCAYHIHHSPAIMRELTRARYLYPLLGMGAGFLSWLLAGRLTELVAAALLGSFWTLWWPGHWRRRYLKQARESYREPQNRTLFGSHQLSVDDEGMVVRSPSGIVASYPWASIEGLEEEPGYLYAYVSGLTAIILPEHGMVEGSFEALRQSIHEHLAPAEVGGAA